MSLANFNFRNFFGPALAAGLFLVPAASHAQSGGAFAGYGGNWSGNGSITIADQGSERIRCRGTYTVDGGGNSLHQSLRCASDSYKFELVSDINASGSQLTGSWSETSRNIQGILFGEAQPGHFRVNVTGPGFIANLSLNTHGNRQSVTVNSQGTQTAGASITLTRSK